jgi:TolB-like protein/AraC-like DNA-binding protein
MDPSDRQFLDKLVRVTEARLSDEAFGVTQLAREMGINRSGLYRKVKTLTNISISQFISELRLKKAMELLKQNSLNISEIAYATGFGSVTYFSRCFHEYYGCQPGEAKKRMAGEIVSQVQKDGIPEEEPSEEIGKRDKKKRLISKKKFILFASGLIIIIASIIIVLFINRFPEKSIAILPFINDSPDSSNDYFNNGIAEAIRDRLANVRDLKVISRNTTELYKSNKTKPTKRLARELSAHYIVEGSGQKSGSDVLITIQLIDGHKDKHIFSRQYEEKYEDVFTLYGEIALDVANEIRAVITPEERRLIANQSSDDLEVTRLLITGQDFLGRNTKNLNQRLEFRNQAEAGYRKALQIDSTSSDAYVGLANVFYYKRKMDSSLLLTDKAIRFNKKNAKAYMLKSDVYDWFRMNDEKEENLRLALKYDPDYIWAIHRLGGIYYYKGEFAKAFEYLIKTAKMTGQLDPASSSYNLYLVEWNTLHIFRSLFALGFYEDAKRIAGEWLKLSYDENWGYNYNVIWGGIINQEFEEAYHLGLATPEKDLCIFYMGMNLLFLGKYSEALDYFIKIQESERLNGRFFHQIYHLEAFAFLKMSDTINANKYFKLSEFYVDTLLISQPWKIKAAQYYDIMDGYWSNPDFILTSVAAVRGEKEKALGYLRELRKNYPVSDLQVVTFLKLFPMFDNIRNEPEFQDYLHEVENHYLSERKKVEKLLKEEGIIQ